MKYGFHPEAQAEFLAAIEYYEECEPGLGADFAIEFVQQFSIYSVSQMLGPFLKIIYDAARPTVFLMASSIHMMRV